MVTTRREHRAVVLAGGLITLAGFLWLMPKEFSYSGYGEGFVPELPVLTLNIQGHLAQFAVFAAMLVLAIGLRPDVSRRELLATRIVLVVFGAWPVAVAAISGSRGMTYVTMAPLEIAHIAVAVAAGILAARVRLIGGWKRWLLLVIAASYAAMIPLGMLASSMPEWTSSSVFLTLYIQLIPWTHFVVGVLMLASGVISAIRTSRAQRSRLRAPSEQ